MFTNRDARSVQTLHSAAGRTNALGASTPTPSPMKHFSIRSYQVVMMSLVVGCLPGCASMSSKEKGVVIGAGTGVVAGGAIGKATGGTARGAILGAVIGGTIGGVIGHQMDQQAKELAQNIPSARVERVGEGIQVTFFSGLLFEFDSDRVIGESARNLKTLAKSLDKYPGSNLVIVGHTDSLGTAAYNLSLSQRRARATAAFLTSQGVSLDRMRSEGRGETEPIADNSTEAGQASNRRVEVAIFATNEYKQQLEAKKATKK